MSLLTLKLLAAIIIFIITLLSGFISIGFANQYHRALKYGDAIANGIFIGVALFHLIPGSIHTFTQMGETHVYLRTFSFVLLSFIALWLIERLFLKRKSTLEQKTHAYLLTVILSIHALISGIALGMPESYSLVLILFISIISHKSFETFAYAIYLHRQLNKKLEIILLILLFSLATPIGIILGLVSDIFLHARVDDLLTAGFNALAAGTFLYISTAHSHRLSEKPIFNEENTVRKVIYTTVGVILMAVLSIIW